MKRIFLTGFMGSGKTTVGRLLAERLKCRFIDLDEKIVEKEGMSIRDIFSTAGESYFRIVEADLLRRYSAEPGVMALGGGTVMNSTSRDLICERGITVYLRAEPETIIGRISGERDGRPLLDAMDSEGNIGMLMEKRGPVYERADWIVDTDERSPDEVADLLYRWIEKGGHGEQN